MTTTLELVVVGFVSGIGSAFANFIFYELFLKKMLSLVEEKRQNNE